MPKRIILVLLSLFIFQFACTEVRGVRQAHAGQSVEAGRGAEKEKIDPNQWDFGRVKQGEILKHDFILKNETQDILGINNIHTSCGCIVSLAEKKSLLPQGSTAIKVTFNSQGYTGPVTQFVYVNTDNADLAIIKFTIKAQVVKE